MFFCIQARRRVAFALGVALCGGLVGAAPAWADDSIGVLAPGSAKQAPERAEAAKAAKTTPEQPPQPGQGPQLSPGHGAEPQRGAQKAGGPEQVGPSATLQDKERAQEGEPERAAQTEREKEHEKEHEKEREREREKEHIRQIHLNALVEHLSKPAQDLRDQCRFESDIATPAPKGLVALTFDDGPEPEQTPHILEVLARHGVPATFFLIGEKMQRHPELVQMVLAHKEHMIASHSWSHPNFHEISPDTQQTEIQRGLDQMPARLTPKLYRYPYGNATCFGNDLLHSQGYRIVGWHVDSCDWAFDRNGTVALHEALSCGVAPQYRSDFVGHVAASVRERHGGIVLMHEIHPKTLAQLNEVIEAIQKDGYTFVRLDDPRLQPSLR